jgi:hypothetical protein
LTLRGSRSIALLLSFAVLSPPGAAWAQTDAAQAEIVAGDQAAHNKDYGAALAHYQTAKQASPGPRAQLGIADSFFQLGRLGEAYEAYNLALNEFGPKLKPAEKALAAKRLKDLAGKTGWLSLRISESGAEVDLDDKPIGLSPLPVLVRVLAGAHQVQVRKAGFTPVSNQVVVGADGTAVLDAKLVATATQAHVIIRASGNEPLRVLVDGVDVGATPWEGDLPPGTHTVAGRTSSAVADTQTVELTPGSRTSIDLVSSATAAHLQVRTSDGKGAVFIDGVARGEGAFAGDVAPGPHTVVVTRDGFERYEKTLTLGERQTWAETVTLKSVAAAGSVVLEGERAYEGIYGGVGLFGAFGIGGMGTELEANCTTLGAASCRTPSPIGGGAFGYVGWTWNPVGFELFLTGFGDTVQQTATFTGAGSGSLVPAASPARTETFTFARAAGAGAVRARAAFQTLRLRGTVAGGVGLSFREMFMQRVAADTTGDSIKTVPNAVSYVSPALSAEAALEIRFSRTFALVVGGQFLADSASIGGTNATSAVPPCSAKLTSGCTPPLGGPANTIPTPAYRVSSGPQVMLAPFVGIAFGP